MGVDIQECYKVFDLPPGASAKEIRQAYVDLCHVWDPQKHDGNPTLRKQTEEKRAEIDRAYDAFKAYMPELSGPSELPGTMMEDVVRGKIELEEIGDAWSARRAITIVIIAVVLIALFVAGASLLLKLVNNGSVKF